MTVGVDTRDEISTHALREEGDGWGYDQIKSFIISTHALREEGDGKPLLHGCIPGLISTHALREEGDTILLTTVSLPKHFYPRPPRGGRRR